MEARMLAAVRAANRETLYSLYFPGGGRVPAAAVVGCVCLESLDYLTCTECERILGDSFRAIELAARKKQRTDPPIPAARVEIEIEQAPGLGSLGVDVSDAAISGMADRLGPGSHAPSDGVEGSDAAISGMADRLGPVSHPPSHGVEEFEGFEAAISGMAARLGLAAAVVERAKEVFRKMEEARAWPHGPGRSRNRSKERSKGPVAYVACLSIACRSEGSALSLRELARAAAADGSTAARKDIARLVAHISRRLGMDRLAPGSLPPLDGVEGSDAAISGMADRIATVSHPPLDGVVGSGAAISGMADRLEQVSNGGIQGFEAAISGMAARLGLTAAVGERAKDVFRKMEEARAWPHGPGRSKYRSKCPLAYAACLSIACRTEGSALSLRELARAVAADGGAAARKDVAKLIAHIRTRLGEKAGQATGIGGVVSVATYVRRFGALVGLREPESAAALEAARRLEQGVLDVRHNADIVAAAVVCMALERAGAIRPGIKDVEAATCVSKMTIYAVCRELRAHDNLLFG